MVLRSSAQPDRRGPRSETAEVLRVGDDRAPRGDHPTVAQALVARGVVRFEPAEDWQTRILLAECTAAEYRAHFGRDPPAASTGNRSLWFALTADRDVFPLCREPEMVNGAVPFDRTGQLSRAHRITRGPSAVAAIYGRQWTPSLSEFAEGLCSASGVSSGAPFRVSSPGAIVAAGGAPNPPLPAGGPPTLPNEWSVIQGPLPVAANRSWRSLERADAGAGAVASVVSEISILADGMGLCIKSGKSFLVRSMSDQEVEEEVDARVLPATYTESGARHLEFRKAVRMLTETPWPNWPVGAPGRQVVHGVHRRPGWLVQESPHQVET